MPILEESYLVDPSIDIKVDMTYYMKRLSISILATACIGLVSCKKEAPVAVSEEPSYKCISAVITIGGKSVNSVVEWNTLTGDARLLNSASFADKSSGQQGSIMGWVPLVNLQQAVQNLASQIQAQHSNAQPTSSPSKSQ